MRVFVLLSMHSWQLVELPICLKSRCIMGYAKMVYYSLIAFDQRVTFWLQRIRSLPCASAYVAFFVHRLAYNHYAIAHASNAANTHAQGSDPAH